MCLKLRNAAKSMQLTNNKIIQALNWNTTHPNATLIDRIKQASSLFLETAYLDGALGEGPQGEFDQNPKSRDDAVDCLTFINTILAIAHANQYSEFLLHLARLNYYNAEIRYQNRYHFMSSDWNPQNAKLGYIEDITQTIGLPTEIASTLIDKPNWILHRTVDHLHLKKPLSAKEQQCKLAKLHALATQFTAQHNHTPYIPLHLVNSHHFPEIAIMQIVRPDWQLREKIGTNLNISHLGLVFQVNNQWIFRHASQIQQKVTDQPLMKYLQFCLTKPSIKGINIQSLLPYTQPG